MDNEIKTQAPSVTPKQRKLLMFALYLGLFEVLFMNAMGSMVGALIASDLQNMGMYAMMYTIYYLCNACTMPITNKLGEKFGRKNIILLGVTLFGGGALLSGFAQTMTVHVIFRAVQGLGQGFLMANILAYFSEFCDQAGRAKAMGLYGTLTGITWVVAPMIGGWVGDNLGWRGVFYISAPVTLIVFIILATQMPKFNFNEGNEVHIDWSGALLLFLTAASIDLVFSWGGSNYSWTSGIIIGLAVLFVVALILFVARCKKSEYPIISPKLFKNKEYVKVILCVCLIGPSLFAVGNWMSVWIVAILGKTATLAGTVAAVKSAVQLVLGYVLGALIGKSGKNKLFLLSTAALYVVSNIMIGSAGYGTPLWFVYLAVIISGYTTTTYSMCLTLHAQNHIKDQTVIGEATSNIQFFQSLMGTVGNALLGMVLSNVFVRKLAGGGIIPEGLLKYTTTEALAPYMNANILSNKTIADELVNALPAEGQSLFAQFVENIRSAYSSSMLTMFIAASVMCAIAFVIMLTMKDPKTNEQKAE